VYINVAIKRYNRLRHGNSAHVGDECRQKLAIHNCS